MCQLIAVSNQAPSVKVYLCNASSTCLPVISLRNAYLSAGSLHRIKEAQGSFTKASDKVPIVIKMAWLVLVVETIFYFAFIEPQLRKVEIFDVPRAVEKIECDMSACGLDS
ncbi:hypothetical protein L596_009411 [Steinernema carpocapsae]|uniref:Uncharacterized protein n=1 Tax=Steinernema carpocapsae TaxID=34508 RepID=A0A4U5PGK9_STECR|nr:hypothetical protein L596_009411 [Steinernema carpocapsae]